jgi:hypothetical protein
MHVRDNWVAMLVKLGNIEKRLIYQHVFNRRLVSAMSATAQGEEDYVVWKCNWETKPYSSVAGIVRHMLI